MKIVILWILLETSNVTSVSPAGSVTVTDLGLPKNLKENNYFAAPINI